MIFALCTVSFYLNSYLKKLDNYFVPDILQNADEILQKAILNHEKYQAGLKDATDWLDSLGSKVKQASSISVSKAELEQKLDALGNLKKELIEKDEIVDLTTQKAHQVKQFTSANGQAQVDKEITQLKVFFQRLETTTFKSLKRMLQFLQFLFHLRYRF